MIRDIDHRREEVTLQDGEGAGPPLKAKDDPGGKGCGLSPRFHRRIGRPGTALLHVHVARGAGLSPPAESAPPGAFHVGVAGLVCQTVPGRVTLFQMADDFLSDNRLLKTPNYHVITMA